MDTDLNNQVANFICEFKNDLKVKTLSLSLPQADKLELVEYIYNYPRFQVNLSKYEKKKREPKKIPPINERCTAKRSNGEQCSRRKKKHFEFCGTHLNHSDAPSQPSLIEKELVATNVNGILHYVGEKGLVFSPEDVLRGSVNPKHIGYFNGNEITYTFS